MKPILNLFGSQIATILTSLFMVSMGESEDFLTSMGNKEKKRNGKYYTDLSFEERFNKLGKHNLN